MLKLNQLLSLATFSPNAKKKRLAKSTPKLPLEYEYTISIDSAFVPKHLEKKHHELTQYIPDS